MSIGTRAFAGGVTIGMMMMVSGLAASARADLITPVWGLNVALQPLDKPLSKPATPPVVPQPKVEEPKDPEAKGNLGDATKPAPPIDAEAQEIVDGPALKVGKFVVGYRFPHPGVPTAEELLDTVVELGETPEGYVMKRPGVPTIRVRLGDVVDRPIENYRLSALEAVTDALGEAMADREILAVIVRVAPDQLKLSGATSDPTYGQDLRGGSTDIKIEIITGFTSQVRTLAFGERLPYEQRINHPIHQKIRDGSPVKKAESFDDPNRTDVVRRDLIDDYVYRLNRHPGRRVNVALSLGEELKNEAGEQLPSVSLDYLVIENKPWFVYAQVSNTGTESTGEWRERFGFVHNQLTGRDDTLSLDFVTAGFSDSSNAFIASYEAPVPGTDRLRWRVFGSWNQFTAEDVGQGNQSRDFEGDGWSAGAEIIWNVFQRRELFVDLVGGVKWHHLRVEDLSTGGEEGEDDFFFPYLGARMERRTDTATTLASVNFEFNWADLAGTASNLDTLGRTDAEDTWAAMQWDVSQSIYLEPILIPSRWKDVQNGSPTLAHELVLSFKGQYAFDNRIVPSFEQTVGGLYTVRGYRESAVAGDGVVIGSAEYRFHVPKAFKKGYQPDAQGRVQEPGTLFGDQFRWVPQQAYGAADWDLILKGFVDVGRTIISDVPGAEEEETLIGVGVGAEFQVKSNFSLRVDWGIALEDVESAEIKAGSNRVHFLATFLF